MKPKPPYSRIINADNFELDRMLRGLEVLKEGPAYLLKHSQKQTK